MKTSNRAYTQTAGTAANKKGSIFANRHCARPTNLPVFTDALLFLIGIKISLIGVKLTATSPSHLLLLNVFPIIAFHVTTGQNTVALTAYM